MASPSSPPSPLDDGPLVEACLRGDPEGWRQLEARHGLLMEAVVLRVLDERRPGHLDDAPAVLDAVNDELRAHDAEALRAWEPSSTLRHYLAVVARQVAETRVQDATPTVGLGSLPAPAAFLDDLIASEPAEQVSAAVDRFSPQVGAVVRLRLRGVDRQGIAAALGTPRRNVLASLERVAERLGELHEGEEAAATEAWRLVLDCATVAERAHLALRTESEPAFQKVRESVGEAWHALRERSLSMLLPRTPSCLDAAGIAAFADGSMRGAGRARAEGHIATCGRCVDQTARLTMDLRVTAALRDAGDQDRDLALTAACLATGRYGAATVLAERAMARGVDKAVPLVRVARIGRGLAGERAAHTTFEPSQVVQTGVPSDEEAPLVAFDALYQGNPHAAARAIDDRIAKQNLGTRLRLLAAAAGHDLEMAQKLATDIVSWKRVDPALRDEAEAVRALPDTRPLPREILHERLDDLIGELTRFILLQYPG
ncbi:MAG: RNA polymerase sigma factor [Myxococcota bacterium]